MRIFRPFLPVKKGLNAADLFALATIAMIFSHLLWYFFPAADAAWRLPDRIFVPVFLVSVGYNTGRAPSAFLYIGAIVITAMNAYWTHALRIDILGVIILLRLCIEPLMAFMARSRLRFWTLNACLILLYPWTAQFAMYGTLAVLMAVAGWINRNRGAIAPKIVDPRHYFIFSWLVFVICTGLRMEFSAAETVVFVAGTAYMMFLLYNMRQLLLNLTRPRDPVEHFCRFLGHKSLEIYVVHLLAFELIAFYLEGVIARFISLAAARS